MASEVRMAGPGSVVSSESRAGMNTTEAQARILSLLMAQHGRAGFLPAEIEKELPGVVR